MDPYISIQSDCWSVIGYIRCCTMRILVATNTPALIDRAMFSSMKGGGRFELIRLRKSHLGSISSIR